MMHLMQLCKDEAAPLKDTLKTILLTGFVRDLGCITLKSQHSFTQPPINHFVDETGYECFVNHLHLEDVIPSDNVCLLLQQALMFAAELFRQKTTSSVSEELEYIISSDQHEVNIRFHVVRAGQCWLSTDLEKYEEAIGVIRLS